MVKYEGILFEKYEIYIKFLWYNKISKTIESLVVFKCGLQGL